MQVDLIIGDKEGLFHHWASPKRREIFEGQGKIGISQGKSSQIQNRQRTIKCVNSHNGEKIIATRA